MSLRLDMDVHIRRQVTVGLRRRGVDVLTPQEDDAARMTDPDLLDRATTRGRVLFSQDHDLLREAARRQGEGIAFAGLIFGEQSALTIGQCIRDLELLSKVLDPEDIAGRVGYLPLRG